MRCFSLYNRSFRVGVFLFLFCRGILFSCMGAETIFPDPVQVHPLTGSDLLVRVSYRNFYTQQFRKRYGKHFADLNRSVFTPKYVLEMEYRSAVMDLVREYRQRIADSLRDESAFTLYDASSGKMIQAGSSGYFLLPEGHLLHCPGVEAAQFHVIHHLVLHLKKPLRKGEYILHGPSGIRHSFLWDPEKIPSPVFQVSDCSSVPEASRFGCASFWTGTGQGLDLQQFEGKIFELVNGESLRSVYHGKIRFYGRDPRTGRGEPLRGSPTLVFDFSAVTKEGTYFLRVPTLGISEKFRIFPGSAFSRMNSYLENIRKLRCHHCHIQTGRGDFPGEAVSYRKSPHYMQRGFFTRSGESVGISLKTLLRSGEEKSYPLIPGLYGSWHEDPSGRKPPSHLEAVNAMLCALLWFPGQPGARALLEEALYGLDLYLRVQEKNGAVALRIERSVQHPDELLLSAPGRRSTLSYAHSAALAALVLLRAGNPVRSKEYQQSALRAWNFALDKKNLLIRNYRAVRKNRVTLLRYYEDPALDGAALLDCGLALYFLTGKEVFLRVIMENLPRIRRDAALCGKKLSPWSLGVFLWKRPSDRTLEELYSFVRSQLLSAAETCWKGALGFEAGFPSDLLMESSILAAAWYISPGNGCYRRAWQKALTFSGLNPGKKDWILPRKKGEPDRIQEVTRVWGLYFPAEPRRRKDSYTLSLFPGERGKSSTALSRREQKKEVDHRIPVYYRSGRAGTFSMRYSGSGEENGIERLGTAAALFYMLQSKENVLKDKKIKKNADLDLKK